MTDTEQHTTERHIAPFIYEEQNSKSLHFTIHQLQSKMSKSNPFDLKVDYTRTMMGFLLLNRNPKHIVMIGLGGGSLAKFCYKHLPDSKITVIEINPHVIALRKDFMVPEDDDRFSVIQADGADYIQNPDSDIDVLLVDGYDHSGQAAQLSSKRFYSACRNALVVGGVLAVNLQEDHPLYETFVERLSSAFQEKFVEVSVNDEGNVIVFSANGVDISPPNFRNEIGKFVADFPHSKLSDV